MRKQLHALKDAYLGNYWLLKSFTAIFAVTIALIIFFSDVGPPEVKRVLATTLITSFVVPTIIYMLEYRSRKRSESETLRAAFAEISDRSQRIAAAGIVDAVQSTYVSRFNELLDLCDHGSDIRISTTFVPDLHAIQDKLAAALDRDARLQVVLADPRGEVIRHRGRDLGAGLSVAANDVVKNLKVLKSLLDRCKSKREGVRASEEDVQIRVTQALLGMPILWAKDTALIGYFWHGRDAARGVFVEVSMKDELWLGKQFRDHFEDLFSAAKQPELKSIDRVAVNIASMEFTHLYYASLDSSGKRIWRYIHLEQSDGKPMRVDFKFPGAVSYAFVREACEDVITVRMYGIDGEFDAGRFVFPCAATGFHPVLAGVQAHRRFDEGGTNGLDAALLSQSALHGPNAREKLPGSVGRESHGMGNSDASSKTCVPGGGTVDSGSKAISGSALDCKTADDLEKRWRKHEFVTGGIAKILDDGDSPAGATSGE